MTIARATPQQAYARLQAGDAVIVDIRGPNEFARTSLSR